jgi:hypothetical protein
MNFSSLKQLRPGKEIFLMRMIPLLFIVLGAFIACSGIRDIGRAKISAIWPAANGKIVSSSVKVHHTGGYNSRRTAITFYARILYAFSVNGKYFTGDCVSFGDHSSKEPSYAYRLVNRYPQGKEVRMYYMPDNPKVCVLEPGIQTQAYILPGLGLSLFVIGSLVAIFARKVMRSRNRPNN